MSLRVPIQSGEAISVGHGANAEIATSPRYIGASRDDRKKSRDGRPCSECQQGISLLTIIKARVTSVLDEHIKLRLILVGGKMNQICSGATGSRKVEGSNLKICTIAYYNKALVICFLFALRGVVFGHINVSKPHCRIGSTGLPFLGKLRFKLLESR